MSDQVPLPPFLTRVAMAFVCFFRLLFRPTFAAQILPAYREPAYLPAGPVAAEQAPAAPPAKPGPEQVHASGLFVLSMLQREGRLIDFLWEDIAAYSDPEVGAAARVVHEGCRKVLRQHLEVAAVLPQSEGDAVVVPFGFDAGRIRLTGNVTGQPPYHGVLRHPGWVSTAVSFPDVPAALDPRVLAPAEVELA
jgi:hypothetical protein